MAVFNVAFLNPKLRKSSGGSPSILADQLQILENELAKDGYLSQGDYDILTSKARGIMNSPGLTAAQRSNYTVKISEYQKGKDLAKLNEFSDISRIDRNLKGEAAEDVMMVGNNPAEFLKGRSASIQGKLNDLTEVIEKRSSAGQDATQHMNEFQETLAQYSEVIDALESTKIFDKVNPIKGYAAYVTTNNRGEIVDVDYARYGSKSGYAETNGMIDGFQIFGKINYKEDGKNYFQVGNNKFSAVDIMIPDATNPGSFKKNALMHETTQAGAGMFTRSTSGKSVNIEGATVPIQSYIPRDSWAKGVGGSYYYRKPSGEYAKYINSKEEDIGVADKPVLNIPPMLEQSIMSSAQETIDGSISIQPEEESTQMVAPEAAMAPQTNIPQVNPQIPTAPMGKVDARAPQPQETASSGFMPTAQRTIKSGVNFFKNLFR